MSSSCFRSSMTCSTILTNQNFKFVSSMLEFFFSWDCLDSCVKIAYFLFVLFFLAMFGSWKLLGEEN